MSLRCTLFLLIVGGLFTHCRQSRSYIQVSQLPNYNTKVREHILFLDFLISQNQARVEARLINAVAGNGKMKDLGSAGTQPNLIKAVHYFRDRRAPVETFFEHPLFRSAEVFSEDGTLGHRSQAAMSGTLSMRVQEDPAREKIDLYSVTPAGAVKLYSLQLRQ